jgi:ABC-type polysaccharide/polyol phosphate export permease
VALKGDIYYGLWYPIIVSIVTVVVGAIFLRETRERDIETYEH